MNIEREKKYLIDEETAIQLKEKSLYVIGAIQWYMDDCIFFGKKSGCRIRHTFDKNGNEEWIIATKGDLKEDFTREEEENNITASYEIYDLLYLKPVVAKLRYFLMYEPAEIVLDEFIQLDKPYNVPVKYLVEIETHEDFETFEKLFNLNNPLSIEEFRKYINKNIAIVSQLRTQEIIETVKKELIK